MYRKKLFPTHIRFVNFEVFIQEMEKSSFNDTIREFSEQNKIYDKQRSKQIIIAKISNILLNIFTITGYQILQYMYVCIRIRRLVS